MTLFNTLQDYCFEMGCLPVLNDMSSGWNLHFKARLPLRQAEAKPKRWSKKLIFFRRKWIKLSSIQMLSVEEEKPEGGQSPAGFQVTHCRTTLSHSAMGLFASIAILGFDYQSEGSQYLCLPPHFLESTASTIITRDTITSSTLQQAQR